MVQITNRGKMWWLLKGKKVVGFASTYQIALAKAWELEQAALKQAIQEAK